MTRVSHFGGPKALCRWTRDEINQAKATEIAFFHDNPGVEFRETDLTTGVTTVGVRLPTLLPDALGRSAYLIVNDLRNALDQAVHAASSILGTAPITKSAFPFGQTRNDVVRSLQTAKNGVRYRDIPGKLHPKLLSFEPWWKSSVSGDGNNLLRSLGAIANPNKHLVPITVGISASHDVYGWGGQLLWVGHHSRGNGEFELYKVLLPFHANYQFEPQVTFGDASYMTNKPVFDTLNELLTIVEGIVSDLEAETARLSQ